MKSCIIRSNWLSLAGGRMDAAFWCAVDDTLRAQAVDPATATIEQVKTAIETLRVEQEQRAEAARSKRDLAAAMVEEARLLEAGLFKKGSF